MSLGFSPKFPSRYLRRGLQITKLCVVMDPLNPRECSGGHTEDKLQGPQRVSEAKSARTQASRSMCLSNFVILASEWLRMSSFPIV